LHYEIDIEYIGSDIIDYEKFQTAAASYKMKVGGMVYMTIENDIILNR